VLNNPHKRQAPPKAHSSLPAVPPADLPRVRRKDFDAYLNTVTPEWTHFQSNIAAAEPDEPGPSTPRAFSPPPDASDPASSSQTATASGRVLPSLDIVPPVFFSPKFDLADPRTFSTVTEQDLSPDADPTSLSYSLPLLEKFSHYADTIEQHLTHEISLRSSSFFAALSNLHHLHAESSQCVSQISRLRKLLVDVDENVAKRGLQVVSMERKLQNMKMVDEGIEEVKGIVDMTSVARRLVSQGQWGQALGLVEHLDNLWVENEEGNNGASRSPVLNGALSPIPSTPEGEEPPSIQAQPKPRPSVPLASLDAFSALPVHLRGLTLEIASSLSLELVTILKEDLLKRIEEGASNKSNNTVLADKLTPILEGLIRTRGLREASLSWREVVLADVKGLIAKVYIYMHSQNLKHLLNVFDVAIPSS
jgi:vacuolar protein sorting-associated protein 54